jgi:hypothetical protein
MSKRLDNLRRILAEPLGAHIDDQRLAEMAAGTTAGEEVDALFATELAHIEQCLACAAEYDELVTLSVTAVTDMHVAAQEISPQEVFAELIRRAADVSLNRNMVRQLIAALPFLFTQPPASATAFDEALAGKDLAEQRTHLPILQAVRRNLAALTAYLTSASNAVWGRALQTETTTATQGYRLNFQPALAPAIPTLSSGVVGEEWELFSRRVGQMPPLHVDVRARRQTDLACRLIVHVDRPGLVSAAGRQVTVQFAGESVTQVTDDNGNVTFSDVPIAALAELVLTIAEQT